MTLAKRLWLTILFTLASLALALVLTGQQLLDLTQAVERHSARQQLSANLYQLKASVLQLSRLDPLLPDSPALLRQTSQTVAQLSQDIAAGLPAAEAQAFRLSVTPLWSAYQRNLNSALTIAETAPQDALAIRNKPGSSTCSRWRRSWTACSGRSSSGCARKARNCGTRWAGWPG